MKKVVIGAAVSATALAALRYFGPALHERAMTKCRELMSRQGGCPAGRAA